MTCLSLLRRKLSIVLSRSLFTRKNLDNNLVVFFKFQFKIFKYEPLLKTKQIMNNVNVGLCLVVKPCAYIFL